MRGVFLQRHGGEHPLTPGKRLELAAKVMAASKRFE
jgi:hypothetical protein